MAPNLTCTVWGTKTLNLHTCDDELAPRKGGGATANRGSLAYTWKWMSWPHQSLAGQRTLASGQAAQLCSNHVTSQGIGKKNIIDAETGGTRFVQRLGRAGLTLQYSPIQRVCVGIGLYWGIIGGGRDIMEDLRTLFPNSNSLSLI